MPAAPATRPFPLPAPVVRSARQQLRVLVRDTALTDPVAHHPAGHTPWEIDPQPLILTAEEWQPLEAALRQRARFVNALLGDIYSRQEALVSRLLPPEVVLCDPYYRRPCLHLEALRDTPARLVRFDLVRSGAGPWMLADTRANTPTGLGFAVQTRRFLTQELSTRYAQLPDYHRITNYPLRLLATLQAAAPAGVTAPSIVVLTAGPSDPFYGEHSFLARKMGVPLAEGDDLLVFDNRAYFKTIAGLERVDVIYRRLNDAHIDPVVFSTDRETAGIPGLLQCIRHGTVAVVDAIGCGVAENRSLAAYTARLMRFFLGEKPLLPDVPTYLCGDNDQLDQIIDHATQLTLVPIHPPRLGDPLLHAAAPQLTPEGHLPREVRENQWAWVARPRYTAYPTAPHDEALEVLTCYALASTDGDYEVVPGGLARRGTLPPPDRIGTVCDCIVLHAASTVPADLDQETQVPGVAAVTLPLGSRAAESLCWLGRYLERGEASARMLAILDDVALEEIPTRDRRRWMPVWQGLLEATGHTDQKITLRTRPHEAFAPNLAWSMVLDPQRPASIYNSVAAAAANARRLRDHLPPEASVLLPQLVAALDSARAHGHRTPEGDTSTVTHAVTRVLTDLNAFLGTAERTMLHDAGWYFLRLGVHLERAIMTCSALRFALGETPPTTADLEEADAPALSALVRMLGSQDAYRRLYRTRSRAPLVADLFLRQGAAPRSLVHNLGNLLNRLQAIRGARAGAEPLEAAVRAMVAELRGLELARFFPRDGSVPAESLGDYLSTLLGRLYDLHPLLSDYYFSHQAVVAPTATTARFDI